MKTFSIPRNNIIQHSELNSTDCNGTATFTQQCYQETTDLDNLTIIVNSCIRFELESFIHSNVTSMQLYIKRSVYFVQQDFQNKYNLTTFEIQSMGRIHFKLEAFIQSKIISIHFKQLIMMQRIISIHFYSILLTI